MLVRGQMKFLLDNRANPNEILYDNYTILMHCCSYGRKEFASLLISYGADYKYKCKKELRINSESLTDAKEVTAIDLYGYEVFRKKRITEEEVSKLFNERDQQISEYFRMNYPKLIPLPSSALPDFLILRGHPTIYRKQHVKSNELDERTLLKAKAVELRNFFKSHSHGYTESHNRKKSLKSANLIIHFDDDSKNEIREFPTKDVKNVNEAYRIMVDSKGQPLKEFYYWVL